MRQHNQWPHLQSQIENYLKYSYNIKNELSNNRIEVLIIFSAFLLKSDYVKHISIEKGQKGRL